jgi:hypothetical protein
VYVRARIWGCGSGRSLTNALATAKQKVKLEAQKIAGNRKKRKLEQVKISLQEKK